MKRITENTSRVFRCFEAGAVVMDIHLDGRTMINTSPYLVLEITSESNLNLNALKA